MMREASEVDDRRRIDAVSMRWENLGVAPPYHPFALQVRLSPPAGSGAQPVVLDSLTSPYGVTARRFPRPVRYLRPSSPPLPASRRVSELDSVPAWPDVLPAGSPRRRAPPT